MIVCHWHGWRHWMIGMSWNTNKSPKCWVFRWIVALGPFDIRWLAR